MFFCVRCLVFRKYREFRDNLILKFLNLSKITYLQVAEYQYYPYKMEEVFVYPYIELSFIIYVTRLLLQI